MLRDILIQKGLSNREAEVAELVSRGLSNKEVANQLFVTEKTVKFHLTNIYKKMSVKSRAQLIVWCLPHLAFLENGEPRTEINLVTAPIGAAAHIANNNTVSSEAAAAPTIPAGNATVGTIIPGRGNSDMGAMGGF
jgi:DNA-binding CsgD family transcriptional regulator